MTRTTLPELSLSDGDLFGAALVAPAFASDLSTWNVTIHKHGLLTQTVLISQPPTFDGRVATLRQHVNEPSLAKLKQIVHDENLLALSEFPQMAMTDQEFTRLIIRMDGRTNVIDAYGPHAVAMLGDSDAHKSKAERYCKLWDAIIELTPFSPYRD